jgi:hypothetical protein
MFTRRVGLAVKCMRNQRMWMRGEVVKEGKVLKKVNNKRRKKGIPRVSRHLEVMLSLVLLVMREKETQR